VYHNYRDQSILTKQIPYEKDPTIHLSDGLSDGLACLGPDKQSDDDFQERESAICFQAAGKGH
jgi:hypothetical protein